MAGGPAVGQHQLLRGEVDVADEGAVDDKALANADKLMPTMGKMFGQQSFHLPELDGHYPRFTIGEYK